MPTYQYRCTDCGQSFERYQSFSDDPITVCPLPAASSSRDSDAVNGAEVNGAAPACGGEVRKIFSNVGISFKGSGFYRNDSRASSGSSSSGSSGSDSAGRDSSSGKSSDSESKQSTSSNNGSSSDKSSSTVGAASASG